MSPEGFVSLDGPPDYRCCVRFYDESGQEMQEIATDFCNLNAAVLCLREVVHAWKHAKEAMCDPFLKKAYFAYSCRLEVIDNE